MSKILTASQGCAEARFGRETIFIERVHVPIRKGKAQVVLNMINLVIARGVMLITTWNWGNVVSYI